MHFHNHKTPETQSRRTYTLKKPVWQLYRSAKYIEIKYNLSLLADPGKAGAALQTP